MTVRTSFGGSGRIALLAFIFLILFFAVPGRSAVAQEDLGRDPTLRALREALFSGLANQVGTLPNPAGGGFAQVFDPRLGIVAPTHEFGPVFSERADTTGDRKVTFTVSYSRHTFDEVDGAKLRTDGIQVILIGGGTRLNQLTFREQVTADVGTFGVLYGLTDRIDIGLTIPVLKVRVKERVTRQFFQDCLGDPLDPDVPCSDLVETNDDFVPQRRESTGLGDVVLRGKWKLPGLADRVAGGRVGIAAALDVKLPTGDKGDRSAFANPEFDCVGEGCQVVQSSFTLADPPRGTGIVRVKPQLIASGSWFGIEPHINVGAELGTTAGITNDLVYAVGLAYTLVGRATVSADLLGRHSFGVNRARVDLLSSAPAGVIPGKTASADTLTASFGLKVNPPIPKPLDSLLVFLNFLVPLDNTGIRDDVTPTFGLEWSF